MKYQVNGVKWLYKGHIVDWYIEKKEETYHVSTANATVKRKYSSFEKAIKAIEIAEKRYANHYKETKVKNPDIWFSHGVLIVDDMGPLFKVR